jgi:hypothetical protein
LVAKFSSVAGKLVQNDVKQMSWKTRNKITHGILCFYSGDYTRSTIGTRVRHHQLVT